MYTPKITPKKFRTLIGLIELHIVFISSLNPGGGGGKFWGGCIATPNPGNLHRHLFVASLNSTSATSEVIPIGTVYPTSDPHLGLRA